MHHLIERAVRAVVFTIAIATTFHSLAAHAAEPSMTVEPIRTTWPVAREASGLWGAVGEVVLVNTGATPVTVTSIRIETLDESGAVAGDSVYTRPKAVGDALVVVGTGPGGEPVIRPDRTRRLAPGDTAFVFVGALAPTATAPVSARVTVAFREGESLVTTVGLAEHAVDQQFIWPLRFSPETPWVAANAAGSYHHWKAVLPGDGGGFFVSQRYAIDTAQVDARGRTSRPVASPRREDYYAWGEEVVSPGSGTVVAVVSDRVDQEIGSTDAGDPAGNYVIVRFGPELFGAFAHLMRGSALVDVGDTVEAGQVLGLVGNSGNTTEPHLHFHFMDDWNPEATIPFGQSQGLPALLWGARDVRGESVFTLDGTTPLSGDLVVAPE